MVCQTCSKVVLVNTNPVVLQGARDIRGMHLIEWLLYYIICSAIISKCG